MSHSLIKNLLLMSSYLLATTEAYSSFCKSIKILLHDNFLVTDIIFSILCCMHIVNMLSYKKQSASINWPKSIFNLKIMSSDWGI